MCDIVAVAGGAGFDVGELVTLDIGDFFGDAAVAVGSHSFGRKG